MRIDAGAQTDVGAVRKNNEDTYQVEPSISLYVLSDGMGGETHGEVASRLAVDTVVAHCLESQNNRAAPLFQDAQPDLSEQTNRLVSAVTLANRKVFESAADPALHGMGATIVAAWITDRRLSLAHVGDSRAYLLRAGTLEQLTADHSLVAERVRQGILTPQQAESSSLQSVLIRAVGTKEQVKVDTDEQILLDGDVLLLCSDGLTRMVTDPEIASTLMTVEPAQAAADRLVELANEYGGEDNVTAIVVRLMPGSDGFLSRLRLWPRRSDRPAGKPASPGGS